MGMCAVVNKFRIVFSLGVGCRGRSWEVYIPYILNFVLFCLTLSVLCMSYVLEWYHLRLWSLWSSWNLENMELPSWAPIQPASLNSTVPLVTWVGQTKINLLIFLTLVLEDQSNHPNILSLLSFPLALHRHSEKPSFSQKPFQSWNIFVLPFQGSPQPVFLEREKQEKREDLCHLCTLGWSLVLHHIKFSFSRVASLQRVKDAGALRRSQLLLGAWHIRLLSPHHAKRMSNLLGTEEHAKSRTASTMTV